MIIVIRNVIGSEIAVKQDDAEKLYCVLRDTLRLGKEAILSFAGIKDFISSFLNMSVGKLYDGEFPNDFVDNKVSAIDMDDDDRIIFERVRARAKEYYANPEHYEFSEVLHDDE